MFLDGLFAFLSRLFFLTGALGTRSSFPQPLSDEEEAACLKKFREEGDQEARNKLISHNLRLVAHIVKKYQNAAETDDLISVGTIGLIKAVNTFSPDKGTQLGTFAARCIENEILMLLRASKKHRSTVSLSEAVGNDKEGNELTLMDLLTVNEEGVFSQVENTIMREKLLKLLRQYLTEREFVILCSRYGLNGRRPLTQREIAKALHISRSYISRIEKKALQKVRENLDPDKF